MLSGVVVGRFQLGGPRGHRPNVALWQHYALTGYHRSFRPLLRLDVSTIAFREADLAPDTSMHGGTTNNVIGSYIATTDVETG